MKKLILSIALAALAVASASAQVYTTLLSGTDVVPIGLSNTTTTVYLGRTEDVLFYSSFKLTGAGTSGVLFRIDGSADNANWNTGIAQYFRAAAGTAAVEHTTNFTFTAYPYIRVQIHNTNSVVATNWTFKAVTKKKW